MRGYIALLPLVLLSSLAIAEPNDMTFSCNGTSQNGKDVTNVANMGLVVNLEKKTVSAFRVVATIVDINDVFIGFRGKTDIDPEKDALPMAAMAGTAMAGTVDRITGQAEIAVHVAEDKTANIPSKTEHFSLICKPTKRLF